ncbi:MAG: COX15/CtaA family protein [Chthoniobacterales bacterium]
MHGTAAPYGTGRTLVFAYAVFTVVCAFVLLLSGGLVTSKGVGMTVPDWPNSYGYNMFTFPISRWVGGIFYEHTHRLIASGVGLLTVILAVLLWFAEPRRWVRVLGYIAVGAVILQGVLGGLRVVLIKDEIGIFHGMLAQAFMALLIVMAIALSKAFAAGGARWRWHAPGLLRWAVTLTVLVYLQLAVGATMRHEHAGLAVHDFPLAYGQLWPSISAPELEVINAGRIASGEVPTTLVNIHVHMLHRLLALVVFSGIAAYAWHARKAAMGVRLAARWWLVLVVLQVGLGAWTVLSDKAADITTAHVAVGALTLFLGVSQCFLLAAFSPRAAELKRGAERLVAA